MSKEKPYFKRLKLGDKDISVLAAFLELDKDRLTTTDISDWSEETIDYDTVSSRDVRYRVNKKFNADKEDSKFKYLYSEQPDSENGQVPAKQIWLNENKQDEIEDIVDSYSSELSVSKYSDMEAAFTALVDQQEEIQERLQEVENSNTTQELKDKIQELENKLEEYNEEFTNITKTLYENQENLEDRIDDLEDKIE